MSPTADDGEEDTSNHGVSPSTAAGSGALAGGVAVAVGPALRISWTTSLYFLGRLPVP